VFTQALVRYAAICIIMLLVFIFGPVQGSLVVCCFLFGILCLNRPRVLLAAYFGFIGVSGYMLLFLRNPVAGLLDEFFTLVIFCIWLAQHMIKRTVIKDQGRFMVLSLLLLAVVFISFLVNRSSPIGMLHFGMTYLSFIPVFLMVREQWLPALIGVFSRWMILFMAVQVVLSVSWLAGINPMPNFRQLWADRGIGTFGNCAYVGYLCVACISVLLNLGERSLPLRLRIAQFIGLGVLGVMFFLTFTIHAYPALLLCCAWWARAHYIRHKSNPIFLMLVTALIGMVLTVAVMWSQTVRSKDTNIRYFEHEKAMSIMASVVRGPKGVAYRGFFIEVPRQLPFPLLGAGPGNGGSMVAFDRRAPLANRYINYVYESIIGQRMMASGSIMVSPHVGLLAIYSDIGFLGCLLYYGLHLLPILRLWRLYNSNAYEVYWQKHLAYAMIPVATAWLFLSTIFDALNFDFLTSCLWAAFALAWSPLKREGEPETRPS